tara:strand:- start:17077 stop:17847 length:771 start_codon:yes stop_codon:yes gene_type:complete
MKAVILAGGLGSRLSEETHSLPKPMVEVGGRPILWHILKYLSSYGINEFVICLGYKGYVIKEYFSNYFLHMSDVTFDIQNNKMVVHKERAEEWKITLVETGLDSMTGGRIKRVSNYLDDDEDFIMTYGDGLSNIDISKLIESHKESKSLATVTACNPPARFGSLKIEEGKVVDFDEKPAIGERIINGGYFVLSKKVLDYITDDSTVWEQDPIKNLVKDNELNAYVHSDFFQPMDTLRDRRYLESLWKNSKAPWKNW